jgi:hypothetical protein
LSEETQGMTYVFVSVHSPAVTRGKVFDNYEEVEREMHRLIREQPNVASNLLIKHINAEGQVVGTYEVAPGI